MAITITNPKIKVIIVGEFLNKIQDQVQDNNSIVVKKYDGVKPEKGVSDSYNKVAPLLQLLQKNGYSENGSKKGYKFISDGLQVYNTETSTTTQIKGTDDSQSGTTSFEDFAYSTGMAQKLGAVAKQMMGENLKQEILRIKNLLK